MVVVVEGGRGGKGEKGEGGSRARGMKWLGLSKGSQCRFVHNSSAPGCAFCRRPCCAVRGAEGIAKECNKEGKLGGRSLFTAGWKAGDPLKADFGSPGREFDIDPLIDVLVSAQCLKRQTSQSLFRAELGHYLEAFQEQHTDPKLVSIHKSN